MSSIFLSHNSKDKKFVRELANRLKNYKVKVWIDEAEIKIGDSLIKKIERGIDEMEFLGVVLSPNSIDSEWVNKEVEMAMNGEINGRKVNVLPLLYRKCTMPGFLRGKLYADFTSKKKFDESFDKVLETLGVDKKDNTRVSGATCMLEKDFRQKIINHFSPRKVEIKYFEDLSGIEYIKVDSEESIFTYYSYWTKPTINSLLTEIFKIALNDVEFMDEYVYLDTDSEEVLQKLIKKYKLPKDSYPGQWSELSEGGEKAWSEWEEWFEERRVVALISDN